MALRGKERSRSSLKHLIFKGNMRPRILEGKASEAVPQTRRAAIRHIIDQKGPTAAAAVEEGEEVVHMHGPHFKLRLLPIFFLFLCLRKQRNQAHFPRVLGSSACWTIVAAVVAFPSVHPMELVRTVVAEVGSVLVMTLVSTAAVWFLEASEQGIVVVAVVIIATRKASSNKLGRYRQQ
jgi:hypothetical protein